MARKNIVKGDLRSPVGENSPPEVLQYVGVSRSSNGIRTFSLDKCIKHN